MSPHPRWQKLELRSCFLCVTGTCFNNSSSYLLLDLTDKIVLYLFCHGVKKREASRQKKYTQANRESLDREKKSLCVNSKKSETATKTHKALMQSESLSVSCLTYTQPLNLFGALSSKQKKVASNPSVDFHCLSVKNFD